MSFFSALYEKLFHNFLFDQILGYYSKHRDPKADTPHSMSSFRPFKPDYPEQAPYVYQCLNVPQSTSLRKLIIIAHSATEAADAVKARAVKVIGSVPSALTCHCLPRRCNLVITRFSSRTESS
jgi:hypothetical protein